MSGQAKELPPLAQMQDIDRLLSAPEYYHACIGRHSRTVDPPREIVFVIEGEADGTQIPWQSAIDKVVAMNPGARLRLIGMRQHARWRSDGVGPRLRIVEQCDWDGRSEIGAEFIDATALSLEDGPTAELIVAGTGMAIKVIFRVLHAVMDGVGAMHFFQELFRALRGEKLLGTNVAFSDVDLMLHVPSQARARPFTPKSSACLTGDARGKEMGHAWRRISLRGAQSNLLARTAIAMAEFARSRSTAPIRIAIPINLRRHIPGLLATMNFSNMIHVVLDPADTVESFQKRLHEMLGGNSDVAYHKSTEWIRYLPLAWLDRLMTSTADRYTAPRVLETAVLSNLGNFERSALICPGFNALCLYGIPIESNLFSIAFGLQGRVEMTVGMTRVLASGGRLDEFVEFLEWRLEAGC